jgi:hypothetical protein
VTGPSSISVGFHWDQVGLVAVVTPLGSSLGNPNTGASDLVLGAAVISDHLGLMQCTDGPKSYVLAGALAVV